MRSYHAACVVVLLFAAFARAQLFVNNVPFQVFSANMNGGTLLDALADPANTFAPAGASTTARLFDPEGATIYLPSDNTPDIGVVRPVITLVGRLFTNPAPGVTVTLGLPYAESCATGIDASFTPVPLTITNAGLAQFTVPTAWTSTEMELETIRGKGPRPLCIISIDNTIRTWSGFWIRVVWNCDTPGTAANPLRLCSAFDAGANPYLSLNDMQRATIDNDVRTQCCKSGQVLGVGQCVNPKARKCCGGSAASSGQKCCSAELEIVQESNRRCPCRSERETLAGGRVINIDCASPNGVRATAVEDTCCLPSTTVFPGLIDTDPALTTPNKLVRGLWGACYDTTETTKCCSTGMLYDSGSQQCCKVNGIQDISVPCPCASDNDCNPTSDTMRCCRGGGPDAPFPLGFNEFCSQFANFPFQLNTGNFLAQGFGQAVPQGPLEQRCLGQCIDTNYQICCNGVACIREFEKCCNTTCCNKFVGSCQEARNVDNINSRFNPRDFRVSFRACTTIEFMDPLRAFLIFILPAILLATTLGALAIVTVFANRASNRSYSFIETAMIVFAIGAVLFAMPLYFAPVYKYGIFIVIVALAAIVSAAARIRLLNVAVLVALFFLLWYIFDPIPGNDYLNMISYRQWSGPNANQPNPFTNGLWHTTTHMWSDNGNFCVGFYDYFRFDPALRDDLRFDNPAVTTFGYCERGWIATLLVLEGVAIISLLLLFITTLLALILRFRKEQDLAPFEIAASKGAFLPPAFAPPVAPIIA